MDRTGMQKTSIWIDNDTYNKIKTYQVFHDMSSAEFLNRLIEENVEEYKPPKAIPYSEDHTNKQLIMILLTEPTHKKVKIEAVKHGTSMSAYVRDMIEQFVNEYKPSKENMMKEYDIK